MEVCLIDARDLSEAWFLAIKNVLEKGYEYIIDKGSFEGTKRKELDLVIVQIRKPSTRPLIPFVPEGIIPPTSNEYIENYLPYLLTEERAENEYYTYGQDLAPQIPKVIEIYQKSGFETNQAFMSVGDKNSIDLADPQCLRGIDTRIRYGALHFIAYFRSWDLWAGFPSNLAAIQLLKEFMAGEIGVEDGELFGISKGLHLYEYAWDMAKICIGERK